MKGPYHFGQSFAVGCVVLKFVTSSQTLCPSAYGLNTFVLIRRSWVCFMCDCASLLITLMALSRSLTFWNRSASHLLTASEVRTPIQSMSDISNHSLTTNDEHSS